VISIDGNFFGGHEHRRRIYSRADTPRAQRKAQMSKTVILSTARTPFGKMGGGLSSLDATDLGGTAISEALDRADVKADEVQGVVYGQVLQAGQGQIPSRQAQIKGGIPRDVPSETVNKVCASGMRTIGIFDQAIRAGDVNVGVAGGMESMSKAPYLLPGARFGFRMGDVTAIDAMTHDGLTNPFTEKQMINEASEVSNELEITRADMDRFAERSHQLAHRATEEGKLAEEIVTVTVKSKKGENEVAADEAIRSDTTLEVLSKLKAVGGDDATHTAGNSPGVNDGAGAVVVASDEWAKANGKSPIATVLAYGQVADDFAYLARTPAKAAMQALEKIGKKPGDVDLWEINEAFASVAINSVRMLEVDEDKVNVNGGAIALGHPIGASGARIVGALVHELRRRGGGLGCAAICSGGGQGDAILVEVNGA
jgi:acetyl-CoA C-acetyltransferase